MTFVVNWNISTKNMNVEFSTYLRYCQWAKLHISIPSGAFGYYGDCFIRNVTMVTKCPLALMKWISNYLNIDGYIWTYVLKYEISVWTWMWVVCLTLRQWWEIYYWLWLAMLRLLVFLKNRWLRGQSCPFYKSKLYFCMSENVH